MNQCGPVSDRTSDCCNLCKLLCLLFLLSPSACSVANLTDRTCLKVVALSVRCDGCVLSDKIGIISYADSAEVNNFGLHCCCCIRLAAPWQPSSCAYHTDTTYTDIGGVCRCVDEMTTHFPPLGLCHTQNDNSPCADARQKHVSCKLRQVNVSCCAGASTRQP